MMMKLASMEVLLLDTTEKEGEDNLLFHTFEQSPGVAEGGGSPASRASRWSELRGVFAAGMGTMSSVVGEDLATAHFTSAVNEGGEEEETVVGFVNLNEVLFVMIFVDCALPTSVVQYYTRSSCELLVSLLGYPHAKMNEWRTRHKEQAPLEHKIRRICYNVFACIRRDLMWETHLQFAFDGCVPTTAYPLETLARLSAFQVIESQDTSHQVVGVAIFYRETLVVAKTRPDILQLMSQWLLSSHFDKEAESGDGASILLYTWYDAHYALYGVFPAIHSLVCIRHGDLQCFYLLRHVEESVFTPFKLNPQALVSTEDLAELVHFANTRLASHYDSSLSVRTQALLSNKTTVWYCVVVDSVRHTMHAFKPTEIFTSKVTTPGWKELLELLVTQISTSFQRKRRLQAASSTSDRVKRWNPRVKLDFSSDDKLLLVPIRPEDDAGADLSSEDAQIFPPVYRQLERQAEATSRQYPDGGELHHEAERLCLPDGRLVWVIANYYQVYDLFTVCDAAIPIARLEQEMDALLGHTAYKQS